MRRSKSDPSKYARNYRKISQRRMTSSDEKDDEKEIERLRNLLRDSNRSLANSCLDSSESLDEKFLEQKSKRKRSQEQQKDEENSDDNNQRLESLLSPEIRDGFQHMGDNSSTDILIMQSRKKKKVEKTTAILSPEEIKEAKKVKKNTERKLAQLEKRVEQKKRRAELYATLEETSLSKSQLELMQSSANLGKRITKKEHLKQLIQKERAGIELNDNEKSLLYTKHDVVEHKIAYPDISSQTPCSNDIKSTDEDEINGSVDVVPLNFPSTGRKKKKKKKKTDVESNVDLGNTNEKTTETIPPRATKNDQNAKDLEESENVTESSKQIEQKEVNEDSTLSLAEQMMAGLRNLKAQSITKKEQMAKEEAKIAADKEKANLLDEQNREKNKAYIPSEPAILKSAARLGLELKKFDKSNWRVLPIKRPSDIEETRFNLPVSAMEFEIIDAVRNNDVTIICSETGSGKSTQIPQFLYESGMTLGNAKNEAEDDALLIGVTQPRRVAAVSTAKRVCHEMGFSTDNGQSIKSHKGRGNLVAYQTRYETAGLGSKTRVKFMTDGILLSEIKSDLLLRKYSAIVLDEAHERNLNTDVLLGLLSVTLSLRRKTAEEGSLPPLKLIVMSATLRVEDFTGNKKMFPDRPPSVVTVPGRTYPVTIHHSKVTELDDYETVAFKKICSIHKKLPQGGILVFMTGKQEIIRMVNRLKRSLMTRKRDTESFLSSTVDVESNTPNLDKGQSSLNSGSLREMDDEEADGDIFVNNNQDDFDENDVHDDVDETSQTLQESGGNGVDNGSSLDVIILPLYSLLSTKEQAKVFAPVPEGTRLIVVATNIAETSITIPGISYVVDCGRIKCRNYQATTGVSSYDIMWISKAAADQRAGRAGRTGPGHCYRLYSSSLYDRQFDQFALPEVLTRPLEDVVLAMKAMNIYNVADFPFPTAPDQSQLNAAIKLLANIGCIDLSRVELHGGDGSITELGAAVSTLPLGVRYGKMLLVAAQANVLDYAIALVAILSESSPFLHAADENISDVSKNEDDTFLDDLDEIDRAAAKKQIADKRRTDRRRKWKHKGGDILAGMLALGAYSYASQGSCQTSRDTCQKFCEENRLNPVIMERVQKMRIHLAKLAKQRLGKAEGYAAKTGGILKSMPPPNTLQESLLKQVCIFVTFELYKN